MQRLSSYILAIPLAILLFLQCSSVEDKRIKTLTSPEKSKSNKEKIAGVSFVSPHTEFGKELIAIPKQKVGANWLCFMPFGVIGEESNQVKFEARWQWWGEKKDGITSMITMAQKQSYKTMLKPQIWIRHGAFTGYLKFESETDWIAFEKSYSTFILNNARLADSLNVDLFCIGTELEQFVKHRPKYWNQLITNIKSIYKGPITYAANWDEYKRTPFWNQLDYIGIDGYFPLSDLKSPSIEEMKKGWVPHQKLIKTYADSLKKQILFTEYGFRSRDFAAQKPWESDRGGNINLEIQSKAYEAFFQTLWKEPYFAGGFLWKWFPKYNESGGPEHTGFSPQRKPVEEVIKKYYELNSSN
jgi:hypothetical protein